MKYDDFKGTIEELIDLKLHEIEESENIKILHAVESGSRAWGFASADSDYDVRFIYVRPKEYYLKLEKTKDIIDWELNDILDINGWDLRKVLQLFYKSNSTLFEWANSPIIYYTTSQWTDIYNLAKNYFSVKANMYHYYGTAKSNFYQFLQDDFVKYKKYFYVIRPILACNWIDEKACPPPVLFSELLQILSDKEIKETIHKLLEIKIGMKETDKGKRIEKLNNYIENQLIFYNNKIVNMSNDKKYSWDKLNEIFLKCIK